MLINNFISLNGSKAVGKSTLAHTLSEAGYGNYAQFYLARYEFQRWYLPVFDPNVALSKWKRHTALLCKLSKIKKNATINNPNWTTYIC